MSSFQPPPEFFVDRSLGRHQVAAQLRSVGWRIRTHHEVYGVRDERVADVEWIADCDRLGLAVLSKDRRLRYRPAEIEAIARSAVPIFVLVGGSLRADEQVARFERNRLELELRATEGGPALWAVHATHIERLFP